MSNWKQNTEKKTNTSQTETFRLLSEFGEEIIKQCWTQHGPTLTANRFNTSKAVIQYIAKKFRWRRRSEYCPNILKAVQRGKKIPSEYPALIFETAMLQVDPDQPTLYRWECNPYVTWESPKVTTGKKPVLPDEQIPRVRMEVDMKSIEGLLTASYLPDFSKIYFYINSLPEKVCYVTGKYGITVDEVSNERISIGTIDKYLDPLCEDLGLTRLQGAELIEQYIDPAIEQLQQTNNGNYEPI